MLIMSLLFLKVMTSFSASYQVVNGFRYSVDTQAKVATLESYDYSGDIVIPDSVLIDSYQYPVVALGKECFKDCIDLTSVTLPSGLKTLGESCFENDSMLQTICIPNNVGMLPKNCFQNCKNLTTVELPSSISYLDDYCFSSCSSLSNISLENIYYIGSDCFSNCNSLKELSIYAYNFGFGSFSDCKGLKSVVFLRDQVYGLYSTFYGCSNLENIVLPKRMSVLDNTFFGCKKLKSIHIPDDVYGTQLSQVNNPRHIGA